MIKCEFTRTSRQIVERFLQSAVIVDDYAILDPPVESSEKEPNVELSTPQQRPEIGSSELPAVVTTGELTTEATAETTDEAPDVEEEISRFNAKIIINSFANKGINCTVLEPTNQEELDNLSGTIAKLAVTSDILIFDWSFGDEGLHTRKLIKNLVHYDEDNRNRLRLIVIYTIDNQILEILKGIKEEIERIPEGPKVEKKEAEYSLHTGSTKIVVLLKELANVPQETPELLDRKVPFEKLADRAIDEFTEMTIGLVPNVALQSMSEIRNNTSKLLNRFNRELDAPYLTHRSLLKIPEEAEEHLVTLIAEELSAILEEKDVKASGNIKHIESWIKFKKPGKENFKVKFSNGTERVWTKKEVVDLLRKGIPNLNYNTYHVRKTQFENAHKTIKLSEMYHCSDCNQLNLDEKLAVLANIRSFYGKPVPKMNLGTIIRTKNDDKYYICIQPRCDCVRITSKTSFLFLPMTVRTDDSIDLVVQADDIYFCFTINKSSYDLNVIDFEPSKSGNGRILAYKRSSHYFFKDADKVVYRWIGELRSEHAINLSFKYASELSRVGLNESEWLRRHAKKP